jgi:hypothetical protein
MGFFGGVLGLVFFLGALFGFYDNVKSQSDVAQSAGFAAGTVYAISNAIGMKIEGLGTGQVFAWAGWGARWGIALPGGVAAGTGAAVGNGAARILRAIMIEISASASVRRVP